MATITTPSAGVSPYKTAAAADPTVLTTTVNGRPSLVASTTIVNGQAALNALITTNQSGVFEGANVVINLEEQNFNTTNQVTSTTNYADGANGSIQYNNGSNGFAGDAYFTYTNGNVVTPGIRTNNYLYGNGAPFTGGGNAAIGNFVFSGDVMTISDANQVMSITGNGTGNVQVNANGNTWTFNNVGNLTLPSNTSGINYANGSPYGATNYSNSNVSSFLAAFGSNAVSTTGNITAGYFVGNGSQLTGVVSSYGNANVVANLAALGSNPVSTTGNVTAGYFIGNGSQLTNITSSYGNANVVANLAALGSNPVSTTGNITGNYFIGNGSQLTGLASGYGNANVVANLAALGSNPVSTTGNITAATINASVYTAPGNVTVTASANTWTFDTSGNLTFPTGMIIDNEGANTRILQNSGALKITANSTASLRMGWTENVGVNAGNLAQIIMNGTSAGEPGNVVVWTGNLSSTTYYWFFDNKGDLTAPGNISAVNLVINSIRSDDSSFVTIEDGINVHGEISATGNITGGNIAAQSGNIIDLLALNVTTVNIFAQDASGINLGANGFNNLVVLETDVLVQNVPLSVTGNITAGNLDATNLVINSIRSDDSTFVTIEDGVNITTGLISAPESMLLSAGANTWTFGTDGRLTFPGTPRIDTGSNNFEVQAAENISLEANAVVNIYTDTSGNAYQWQFGDDGNLTVPGNIILPPGAVLTGTGASPAPSINGFDTINAITFSASGNITGNNLAATNLVINSITSDDSTFVTIEDGVNVNGEISATGNITGNYFIGNGSQLTSVAVPSQTILPTIQSITAVARPAGLFGGGQGGANVTVANNIPVTEYGVIITAGTTSETYKTGALGSIPGTVALTFTTGLNSTQYTLFAYVTSNAGTYYSDAVTGTSGICLLAGTQIALSDGTHKAIEDITYTDKLLSWDFDRGCYTETTAMWIKRSETGSQYNLLTFSDGTTLRTFDQHRIFNKQAGAFTYPMTAATPVGTVTVNEHGQEISLTRKQVIRDTIEYYNVITNYHMNLFSDTVLTSCRFNNIYPIVDMKFAKDGRTLRTRAEFENVPDRFFHGLRLAEQTAGIETVEWYVNRLLSTEVSTQPELAF